MDEVEVMDKSKHLLMDDTNQLTVEDVEAFEASLDPETIADKKLKPNQSSIAITRGATPVGKPPPNA